MSEIITWNRTDIEKNKQQVFLQTQIHKDTHQIAEALTPFTGNEDIFHNADFQHAVASRLRETSEKVHDAAQEIRERLFRRHRFCVVQDTNFTSYPDDIRDLFVLGMSKLIGEPTVTDQVTNTVLWPVRAVANPGMANLTFSQTQDEAEYHTDTQYFPKPEETFGLWSVNPDKNGDGVSGVIDGRELVRRIEQSDGGTEVVQILKETLFPFRVPSVFTASASDATIEVHEAPILSVDPYIRYRRETIEKGLKIAGRKLSKDEEFALRRIEEEITQPDIAYTFFLEKGDVVFMNNHELLHSRTAFTDPNRYLIRVRMRNYNNTRSII